MTPGIEKIGAICLLFAGIALAVAIQLRSSRDRRRIREDLAQRRCRMISAQLTHPRLFGAATYDVGYMDEEGDPLQASCTTRRGVITWPEHLFDRAPRMAEALPEYGQNWRG